MTDQADLAFLAGDSAMASLLRRHEWSQSPLGPPGQWPQSLRSVVNLMLGSAFPMFVAWGPSLNVLYNDAYAQIMGAKHPAGVGRPFLEIWAEISADLHPLLQRVRAGEAFYMENLPLRMSRHGYEEDTWFTFSWSPVLDESGGIAGIYCACTETTRMVLAEQRLRARGAWLQSLFDQAPGFAAVVRGPDHVFEMANQAYLDITGNRPLIGLPCAQAVPEAVGQGFVALLDGVYSSGVVHVGRSVPIQMDRGPGQPSYEGHVDFMYQPLRDAQGQVEGIFVQGHDVTEQHRAQQALRDADRQKDVFLATLAHELRNPLAPIRAATHLLSSPQANAQARVRAVDIITRQVTQMSCLLDDLIDIARITQGRLLLKKERVRLQAVVDTAMEVARPLSTAKVQSLQATVAQPDAVLMVDPLRIAQVLSNLLNNASKYSDRGGHIELAVAADAARGLMRFVVTDNGIGLSEAALRNLFVMFSQEKASLDRSEGGLGIGLALVKALVELHGGAVSASSEGAGRGSTFVVELPYQPHEGPAELAGATDTGASPAVAGGRQLVLLADDNRDACDLLAEVLRLSGHTVLTAHDGLEAARLAMQHQPDVMVLDIGMPGLNGYELARQVRAQPWGASPRLIAATGWGQVDDRRKTSEAGFDFHLTKPFDPEVLAALFQGR